MLAVGFSPPAAVSLADVPEPGVGVGQVMVRVTSTTICATDLKILHGHYPGVTFPHLPGQEWGGEVAEAGASVTYLRPGDKVGVEAHVGCGACARCAEGLYNLCENYGRRETGHAHIGFTVAGGVAEYCAIPARAAHRLPEGLDCDHGAFTDTVGIALWAFERAGGVGAGGTGGGGGPGAGRGLAIGAAEDAGRLALALNLGADHALNLAEVGAPAGAVRDLTAGHGADLGIEFAGSAEAARQSIEMPRRGGRVTLGGATSPGRRLDVDLSTIVRGQLDVFGSVANPRGISRRANVLMHKGLVDVRPLLTHPLPLSEFARAWEIFRDRREGAIRVLLHP